MIAPKCDKCGEEVNAYGAIFFSSSFEERFDNPVCIKYHICIKCEVEVLKFLGKIK